MKALLLFPSIYSLSKTFAGGFKSLGHEVEMFDYREKMGTWEQKINTQNIFDQNIEIAANSKTSTMIVLYKKRLQNYITITIFDKTNKKQLKFAYPTIEQT